MLSCNAISYNARRIIRASVVLHSLKNVLHFVLFLSLLQYSDEAAISTESIKTNDHLHDYPSIHGVFFSRLWLPLSFQLAQSKPRSLCVHTFANTRSVESSVVPTRKRERKRNMEGKEDPEDSIERGQEETRTVGERGFPSISDNSVDRLADKVPRNRFPV